MGSKGDGRYKRGADTEDVMAVGLFRREEGYRFDLTTCQMNGGGLFQGGVSRLKGQDEDAKGRCGCSVEEQLVIMVSTVNDYYKQYKYYKGM